MKICTEAVETEVSLVERPDEPWPHPPGLPATAEAYWRSQYERERARAEVASRARAGSLKWHLDNCRKKLAARVGDVKEAARLRRVVEKLETADHKKTIQYREEELIRLYGKLRESRDELRVSLRAAGRVKEGLKERLLRAKEAARSRSPRSDEALRKALGRSRRQKTALGSLSRENARLSRALRKSEASCGQPYVANGARASSLVEIEVSAHKRVIRRPRWRRGCGCVSSPVEVSAPPAPRLFAGTPYGTSVWARLLFERYAWLWTSVSTDSVYFHVDPSRSAEVAMKLFGAAGRHTVLVCDRYSAYKKLARELNGAIILSFCWAHQRRTIIGCPWIITNQKGR